MDNQKLIHAAVIGGLVAALSDALPYISFVNVLCCLGIAAGGITAMLYLKRLDPDKIFQLPELIQIGLVTGLTGAFFSFVLNWIVFSTIGNWQVEWLLETMENMENLPLAWEELYEQLLLPENQGFGGMLILIRNLILFPVFTLAGTIITNRVLSRRQKS